MTDDLLYAPTHMLLHKSKLLYRLIHSHHHRIVFPSRGYSDAGNENPVEQGIALSLHMIAIQTVSFLLGVIHPASVLVHILLKAIGAVLNHTGVDVSFRVAGIHFSVLHHELHHRKQIVNFGQYVMVWDKLLLSSFEDGERERDEEKERGREKNTAKENKMILERRDTQEERATLTLRER